jgi:hypothetical protein
LSGALREEGISGKRPRQQPRWRGLRRRVNIARSEKREARSEKREARSEKREARSEKREARRNAPSKKMPQDEPIAAHTRRKKVVQTTCDTRMKFILKNSLPDIKSGDKIAGSAQNDSVKCEPPNAKKQKKVKII